MFDLKGSKINREVLNSNDKRLSEVPFKMICKNNCLKDNDLYFILNARHPNLINIHYRDYIKLMETLKRDTLFLQENNIMDYSLLIAIEDQFF